MANRGDVVSVDKLWDIFDREREKAWDGVDAPVGSPEWNIAAGKIDVINNICYAVHDMNAEPRSSADQAEKPVWEETTSVVHTDYADGSAETKTVKHASWCCPLCGGRIIVSDLCQYSVDYVVLKKPFGKLSKKAKKVDNGPI